VDYINQRAGTNRDSKGRLGAKAGRISELDALASKFIDATDKDSIISEVEAIVAKLEGSAKEAGKFYSKVMSVLKTKGKAFLETEPARMEKMLGGATVTPAKIDEFTIRKNILAAFSQ